MNHFSLTIPLLQQQYEQQKWNSSLTKKNQQILKTINGVVQPAHKKSSSDQKVHSSRKIKNWKNNKKVEKKIPHPRSAHCQPIQIPLCLSLCLCLCLSLHLKSLVHSWNSKDTFMELSNKVQSFLSLFFSQSFSSFLINCRSLLFATPFLESLNKVPVFHS